MDSGGVRATRTTTHLLDALHDFRNEPAWEQIDGRYRPVVASLARRLGLGDADAEEVAQLALTEFVRGYREGRYVRGRGRLSSWILGIAHNLARQRMRELARAPAMVLPDEPELLRSVWDEERDRSILWKAFALLSDDSEIEPRTLLAFELCGLRGTPAAEAAAQCGMSVDEVYVAKSRVARRLRVVVTSLTDAFEEDR